jgi:hypothetical protein
MRRARLRLVKVCEPAVCHNLHQAGTTFLILVALLLLIGLALGVSLVERAQAQSGDGYDLTWWTVDGGGATFSTGEGYTLGGTAGQPDAGAALTDGAYRLAGGFWSGAGAPVGPEMEHVYLPLVLRNLHPR